MIRKLISAVAVIALAAAFIAPVADAKKNGRIKEEIHESFDVGSKARLTLTNINGDVTVTGYDGTAIQVDATKSASSQERLDETRVVFVEKNGHVTIEVDVDDDGWDHNSWDHDGSAQVDFVIRVPRATRIDELELVNGDLRVSDVTGGVDASSVNGAVTGNNLTGDVELSAVNGDVELTVRGEVGSIDLNSVNGTVELVVPRDASARVSASTVHGSIRGTGGIKAEKGFVGSSLTSVLGKGDGKIEMSTVNGDIRISHDG